jgi:tripartite-type tricarboxylate transporter receptor subunit TctC
MAGELFKFMTGIEMTHVAYCGSAPALTDLLGGQVQVYFAPISASIEYIRTDKLRALAVTTATRSAALPNVPIVGDFVPGYEMSAWYGIGTPKNTPAEIVDKPAASGERCGQAPAARATNDAKRRRPRYRLGTVATSRRRPEHSGA